MVRTKSCKLSGESELGTAGRSVVSGVCRIVMQRLVRRCVWAETVTEGSGRGPISVGLGDIVGIENIDLLIK